MTPWSRWQGSLPWASHSALGSWTGPISPSSAHHMVTSPIIVGRASLHCYPGNHQPLWCLHQHECQLDRQHPSCPCLLSWFMQANPGQLDPYQAYFNRFLGWTTALVGNAPLGTWRNAGTPLLPASRLQSPTSLGSSLQAVCCITSVRLKWSSSMRPGQRECSGWRMSGTGTASYGSSDSNRPSPLRCQLRLTSHRFVVLTKISDWYS